MHAVEAQQVRVGFDRSKVVDGNDLDIGAPAFDDCAQDVAADPAKSVNSYFDGHGVLLRVNVGANIAIYTKRSTVDRF